MIDSLQTEFALEVLAECDARFDLGTRSQGQRRFIPIVGGSFEGPRIRGRVLPGGGDWQLQRPDGVLEVEARYTLQADDGTLIYIHNSGVVIRSATPYARTTPRFEAPPNSAHAWLNQAIFVASLGIAQPDPLIVRVRVSRVL
jgi:hypothetical protein